MRPVSGATFPTRFECWAELLFAAVALRSPWRQRYLKAAPLRKRDALPEEGIRSTLQALDLAASYHLKPMTCLERSAAGQRILRRRGVPAELRLGVRHWGTGSLEAHAWIEINGKPLYGLALGFSALERRGHGSLAGIRLLSDCKMALPNDGSETDGDCVVLMGRPPDAGAEDWQPLPEPPSGGQAWVRKDGRSLALEEGPREGETLAALLRWAVPFASALQRRVILHASAVSRGGRAWAFLGESGAGKSTLAHAFSQRGWVSVADDLLPCRLDQNPGTAAREEEVVVLSAHGRLGLRAIFFLERTNASAAPRAERLAPAEGLRLLLHHGFGELGNEQMWRSQFEFYGVLVERVPTHRLEVPDDPNRISDVLTLLQEHLRP